MAAMSAADKGKAARIFARKVFGGEVATVTHENVVAAVSALDGGFEAAPTALPSQAQSVAANLNQLLPEPFKSAASTAWKAYLVAIWVGVKYGYILTGGE